MMSSYELQEEITNNQLCRPLKIIHKNFTDKQKEFIKIALDDKTNLMFVDGLCRKCKNIFKYILCNRIVIVTTCI